MRCRLTKASTPRSGPVTARAGKGRRSAPVRLAGYAGRYTYSGCKMSKNNKLNLFLDNIERLYPNEAASCFHIQLNRDSSITIDNKKGLGALVGGCIIIATVMDIASSASEGLKWNETKGQMRSRAMKEFVGTYFPRKYRAINWYGQFRNPLVHNFCSKGLELTHLERCRSKHLKNCFVGGERRICVHIFELLSDVSASMRRFCDQVRTDPSLEKRVRRYIGHYGVLQPRDPDC